MSDATLHGGTRWHDMGGGAAGMDLAVPLAPDHDFALWEKRVDALVILCGLHGLFTVDGLRRALEDMPEDAFERLSYYDRWVASLNQNLLEAGAYTPAQLGAKMAEVRARGTTYGDVNG